MPIKNITDVKKDILRTRFHRKDTVMIRFVWLSDFTFKTIANFNDSDWFLYASCKKRPSTFSSQTEFDTVATQFPAKNLTWELYRMMYKAEAEYESGE
jgi:hypothetical protein